MIYTWEASHTVIFCHIPIIPMMIIPTMYKPNKMQHGKSVQDLHIQELNFQVFYSTFEFLNE